MKIYDIVNEHKKGVRAVKYTQKPKDHSKKFAKEKEKLAPVKPMEGVNEMYGRRSSYYNPLDYERDQQRQMDWEKRDFKRREMEHELGHEDDPNFERNLRQQQIERDRGPWYLRINGAILRSQGQPKVFDWKKGANNYALAILKNKPELQGKIMLTKRAEDDVGEGLDINLLKAAQKHAKENPSKKDPESERNAHKKYGYRTDSGSDDTSLDDLTHPADRKKKIKETATAGATSAGNIASVASPHLAIGKDRGNKSYTGSPGKSGTKAPAVPKTVQKKNPDGTAKNALDMPNNIFGGGAVKR